LPEGSAVPRRADAPARRAAPAERDVRAARARDHEGIHRRLPQRRSVLPQRLLAVVGGRVQPRALSARTEPALEVLEERSRESVLRHPFAHERVDSRARPSLLRSAGRRRQLRDQERPRRPVHDCRLARARRRTQRERARRRRTRDGSRSHGPRRGRAVTRPAGPQPPRLLVRTLAVILATVALLLVAVFVVVFVSVRDQVRQSVTSDLESSQRIYAAVESRRQRELQTQAATLAENPTLKAAIDTYAAEAPTASESRRSFWLTTINNELDKVAARIEADAMILADTHQITLAAVGRLGDRWPRGRLIALAGKGSGTLDGVVRAGTMVFRVVSVPLQLSDTPIATLYLATSLDQQYAEELQTLANARTAIVSDGLLVASTLPMAAAREFEASPQSRQASGTAVLDGESYAFRQLVQIGNTSFFALASIDESSRAATRAAVRNLVLIAAGAALLALVASVWLARMLTGPVGRLSASLEAAGRTSGVLVQLPLTGSSRELDTLTETFNAMMA